MNLALIGNYGATNIGDDAILTALLSHFSAHQIMVFSSNPALVEKQFKTPSVHLFPLGLRSFFKFGLHEPLQALKKVDAVLLGGGGLFQDERLYACFLWAWQVFWVKRLKKPLFICATGVGPLSTWMGQRLTRWAYRQAKIITVRDEASQKCLLDLGFTPEELPVTADPAFLLDSPPLLSPPEKKQLFISIRPWLNHTSTRILPAMTKFLMQLKAQDWEFTFIAMQSIREEDQTFLRKLIHKVGGKLLIPEDFSTLLEQMGQADMALGMRYHFLIAALLTHTPFLALSYSPKVSELTRGTALEPFLIPLLEISPERLASTFEQLIHNYLPVQQHQRQRLRELKAAAQKNQTYFQAFIKSIDPSQAE